METAEYEKVFRHAMEGALRAFGQPLGPEAVAEAADTLLRLSPAQRRLSLSHRHPSNAILILHRLVRVGHGSRHSVPTQYHAAAQAAVHLAGRLPARGPHQRIVEDLRSEAWAHLGNALRTGENLPGAERAFQKAELHLRRGTGDCLLRAELFALEASLRRAQGRLEQARCLLQDAVGHFEALGEVRPAAHHRLNWGLVELYSGEPARALRLTLAAARFFDPGQDRAFALGAFHNVTLCVAEMGDPQRAVDLFRECLPLYAASGDAVLQVRVAWVTGRILASQDDWEGAAQAFDLVRSAFTERGLAFDASLSGLELALAYLHLGRPAAVRALAEEMVPVFVAQQIPREASAALLLFAEAARREAATVDSVATLVADLKGRLAPPGRRGSQGRFVA